VDQPATAPLAQIPLHLWTDSCPASYWNPVPLPRRGNMRPLHWAVVAAVLILIFGMVFGIAGVFLAPILGGIALVVAIVWLLSRRARGKPPVP
jgi:hypothetical protein